VDESWRWQIESGLASIGVSLSSGQVEQLIRYLQLLHKWNKAFNLTAVRDPSQMVSRHLVDSLQVAPWVQGQRVVDVGSGAGLPGIPLAIAFPEREFVLLDSNGKKTRFLTQAKLTLSLANVEVVQSRIEDFRPGKRFDTVVSRAFASLGDFWRSAHHLLAPDGRFLAMKGRYPAAELDELNVLIGFQAQVVELSVGPQDGARTLVIVDAASATANRARD